MQAKLDATAKSPKNAAKTVPTLQNQGGKILLTLASNFGFFEKIATKRRTAWRKRASQLLRTDDG